MRRLDCQRVGGRRLDRLFGALPLGDRGERVHVGAVSLGNQLDRDDRRLDASGIRAGRIGDAAGQRGEFHGLQEGNEFRAILRLECQVIEGHVERYVGAQFDQLARQPCEIGIGNDTFAAFLLLDLAGPRQKRFEIAEFFQKLGCGLRTDPRNARHVVGGITGQRLQVDHLFRRDAPFLDDIGNADLLVLHGIVHMHIGRHQLHQVLVGRDDGDIGAGGFCQPRIGGDDVVGFETFGFDARKIKSAGRLADQTELRHQVLGRRRAVGFVEMV